MANRNKQGGRGFSERPRKRKHTSFLKRYGMSENDFRLLKKTDPQRAEIIKQKAVIK